MMRSALLLPVLGMAAHMPEWLEGQPPRQYQKMLPTQPGNHWKQEGGYDGAWSVQRAAMTKGAYISQQQVRDHAEFGGGHDFEILTTNIDGALEKLHLKVDNFQYNVLPSPQSEDYLKFMKKHLLADNPVIWMVMFHADRYPDFNRYSMNNETNGIYGLIEPVVGILSDSELTDDTVHDSDVFAYLEGTSQTMQYAAANEVPGQCNFGTLLSTCTASCPTGLYGRCVWDQHGYIYAIQDFTDEHDAAPVSLSISPYGSEPYVRGGYPPDDITGTLTIRTLTPGSSYDIYRWDGAEDAFVYTDANKIETFTATQDTHAFEDPKTFLSSSATYYRCVLASGGDVIV